MILTTREHSYILIMGWTRPSATFPPFSKALGVSNLNLVTTIITT
jgi:hypothetical protein